MALYGKYGVFMQVEDTLWEAVTEDAVARAKELAAYEKGTAEHRGGLKYVMPAV